MSLVLALICSHTQPCRLRCCRSPECPSRPAPAAAAHCASAGRAAPPHPTYVSILQGVQLSCGGARGSGDLLLQLGSCRRVAGSCQVRKLEQHSWICMGRASGRTQAQREGALGGWAATSCKILAWHGQLPGRRPLLCSTLTCQGCGVQGKQLAVVRSSIRQRPLPQPDRRQPLGDPAQRFGTYRGVGDCRKRKMQAATKGSNQAASRVLAPVVPRIACPPKQPTLTRLPVLHGAAQRACRLLHLPQSVQQSNLGGQHRRARLPRSILYGLQGGGS